MYTMFIKRFYPHLLFGLFILLLFIFPCQAIAHNDSCNPQVEDRLAYDSAKSLPNENLNQVGPELPTLPTAISQKLFKPDQTVRKSMQLPTSPEDYLHSGPWDPYWEIPSENAEIIQLVGEITSGLDSDQAKAQAIYEWVMENIRYDYSYSIYEALPTLHNRKGVCQGFSLLLAAMMRAGGIPAKHISGAANGAGGWPEPGKSNHAWNELYIDGQWYSVDATWDSCGYSNYLEYSNYGYTLDYTMRYYLVGEKLFSSDHHKIIVNIAWHDYRGETISLEFSMKEPGVQFYYTLDGSEPTIHSTPYTIAIPINNGTVLKAIAVVPQGVISYLEIPFVYITEGLKLYDSNRNRFIDIPFDTTSKHYYLYFLNGETGNYIPAFLIGDRELYVTLYQTVGSLTMYSGQQGRYIDLKRINNNCSAEITEGMKSMVINFTIVTLPVGYEKPQPPFPNIKPGIYNEAVELELDCSSDNNNPWSNIYYTTDGSVPCKEKPGICWPQYTGEIIRLTQNTTIKAVAVLGDWDYVSDVAVLIYQFDLCDEAIVAEDKRLLAISYYPGDGADRVRHDINLPQKGKHGSIITWESSAPDIISDKGEVYRPLLSSHYINHYLRYGYTSDANPLQLSATLVRGTVRDTMDFNLDAHSQILVDVLWEKLNLKQPVETILSNGEVILLAVNKELLKSADGINWDKQIFDYYINDLAWNGQSWAMATNSGILTSSDGHIWVKANLSGAHSYIKIIAASPDLWIAVYEDLIVKSSDGINWSHEQDSMFTGITDIQYNGQQWLAVGNNGKILTSPDGNQWTEQVSGVSEKLKELIWGKDHWIILTQDGYLLSSDGTNWQVYSPESKLKKIAFNGQQFFATTNRYYRVATSNDGIVWEWYSSETSNDIRDLSQLTNWGSNFLGSTYRDGNLFIIQLENFIDSQLEAAVADALGQKAGAVGRENIQQLFSLNASEKGIEKLAKLEFAVNLEELDLSKNLIRDIRELSRLGKLKKLNLSGNQLYDISPLLETIKLGGLAQGATVDLRENQLDLSPDSETMSIIQILVERGVEVLYDSQQPLLFRLTIELRDNSNKPVPDAMVSLGEHTVGSDINGRVSFKELSPGNYSLVVYKENYKLINKDITITGSDIRETIILETEIKQEPVVTTTTLASGTVGIAYGVTLVATGTESITWSVTSGSLPAGLTLDEATGVISGTPTNEETANFTVKATNTAGSDTKELSIDITLDECFIATAAFGSKFTWPVTLLRDFRDQYLLTNSWGTAFVSFYYQHSPPIATIISSNQTLKMMVRVLLAPLVASIFLLYHPAILLLMMIVVILIRFRFMSVKLDEGS